MAVWRFTAKQAALLRTNYIPDPSTCNCASASNYLLGLTPIAMPPFVGGTMIGMGVWSLVFASIGGAGRSLLRNGVGLDVLLNGA